MFRRLSIAFAASCLVASARIVDAQNPEHLMLPALDSLVRANSYALEVDGERLGGRGAAFLFSITRETNFVLLGEEHGSVEVPRFVRALLAMLQPRGFRYLALEVGPQDAAILGTLARAHMQKQLSDLRQSEGTTFPFYSKYAADAELLEYARSTGVRLWGLDQQFIFSSASQLKRLGALASSVGARDLVRSYYQRDVAAARADSANNAGATRFLLEATDGDFGALRAAYPKGPAEATEIIAELEQSAAIYRANAAGLGSSNVIRSRLMKRHLTSYYERALKSDKATPKVLFKLGAMHAGRGLSWLNVYDVGNAVSELAELHGGTSVHIGFWSGEALLMPALDGLPFGAWAVVDFTALRDRVGQLARANPNAELSSLAAITKRYDVMIIAPSLTKSALLQ